MEKTFEFSNAHHDLMARDAKHLLGWRYEPRVIFRGGKGVMLTDVDGNEYYDLTSGMMCMVLGHGPWSSCLQFDRVLQGWRDRANP